MPKINPRAVPIITWLRKCFIRNTLERPTKIDIKIKIEVINRFLSIKKNKLVNKKKFKAWFEGMPVFWSPQRLSKIPLLTRNSPLAPKHGLSSDSISFNKAPIKSPIRIARMMKTKTQNFFLKKK